jgi:hypothetical protein
LTRHDRALRDSDADFTIRNNSDLLSTVTSVSTTMTYLLGGVAALRRTTGSDVSSQLVKEPLNLT